MRNRINDDQRLETCARTAYETLRTYSLAFDAANASWTLALREHREWFLDYTKKVLGGAIPETPSMTALWFDPRVTILIVGAIRGMAAALGMKVTYPAVEAHGSMPAFPKRTIDWSTKKPTFCEE
jgi:hypothetical protein